MYEFWGRMILFIPLAFSCCQLPTLEAVTALQQRTWPLRFGIESLFKPFARRQGHFEQMFEDKNQQKSQSHGDHGAEQNVPP